MEIFMRLSCCDQVLTKSLETTPKICGMLPAGFVWNLFFLKLKLPQRLILPHNRRVRKCPTIPTPENKNNKSGKCPTTKEMQPKDDASHKSPAVTCPSGKDVNRRSLWSAKCNSKGTQPRKDSLFDLCNLPPPRKNYPQSLAVLSGFGSAPGVTFGA